MWLILHLGGLSSISLFVCFTEARILLVSFDPHWAMDHHLGGQLFRAEVETYGCKGIDRNLCKEHIWDKKRMLWSEAETCSPWGGQLTDLLWLAFCPITFSFSKYVSIVSLTMNTVSRYEYQRGWIRNFLYPQSLAGSQGKTHDCHGKRHIAWLSCSGDKKSISLIVFFLSLFILSLYSSLLSPLSPPKEEAHFP